MATIDTNHIRGLILAIGLLATSACGAEEVSTPLSKGNRILAIKANIGADGNFDKTFAESLEAGSETQVIPLDWNQLETGPGEFEPTSNFLAIANGYYAARDTPVHISLRPIHTNVNALPADLQDKPLDDPQTVRRFKALLDWIATQIPDLELTSLSIGSEVDVFLWGNPERWAQWTAFYAAAAAYARDTFPHTLISCETTFAAFAGPDLARLRALHQHSDAVGVSYYPMRDGLSGVRAPGAVHTDFRTVSDAIERKPIIFYQIGYPSNSRLASSPQMQAEFIGEAFSAWDQHAERILMLNIQWMHETPPFGVDQYADYYSHDTPDFRAFLGSLGLQSWSGEPKPAWHKLTGEAKARGFGN